MGTSRPSFHIQALHVQLPARFKFLLFVVQLSRTVVHLRLLPHLPVKI